MKKTIKLVVLSLFILLNFIVYVSMVEARYVEVDGVCYDVTTSAYTRCDISASKWWERWESQNCICPTTEYSQGSSYEYGGCFSDSCEIDLCDSYFKVPCTDGITSWGACFRSFKGSQSFSSDVCNDYSFPETNDYCYLICKKPVDGSLCGGGHPPQDTTPPTTTATAIKVMENGVSTGSYSLVEPVSFTRRDVEVTLACSEIACSTFYCIHRYGDLCNPTSWLAYSTLNKPKITVEGTTYISYYSRDSAENREIPPKSSIIKIDSTDPTTTAYLTSPPGGSEYTSEAPATQDSVKIELSCDDGAGDVSGCVGIGEYSAYKDRGIFYCTDKNCNCEPTEGSRYTGPVIISESDGISCIRYRSVDKAFNYESPRGRAINIVPAGAINLPPTATLSANPSEGESPLTVTFTGGCSDPEDELLVCFIDYGDSSGGLFETGKTNTYSYSSEDYTATLTASDMGGLIGIDDVKITVNQEIVVPELTPTHCNNYTTSGECAADAYHVADDSTPSGFTETCGIVTWQGYSSGGSRIDLNPPCNDTTDCMCGWTGVACDLSVTKIKESRPQCFLSGIPSGTTGFEKCKFTTKKEEYNATTGEKNLTVEAEWISSSSAPAPGWCQSKSITTRVALLPFFAITNLVIVVAVLIVIYVLISLKKRSLKKKLEMLGGKKAAQV